MYRRKKHIALNLDVYGGIDMDYSLAVEEYLKKYDLQGLAAASKYRAKRVLELYAAACSPRKVADITQRSVDSFIQSRIKALKSPYSVNQAIGRLKAFINWLIKRGYHRGHLDIQMMKTVRTVKKSLTTEQIRALLKACPGEIWKMRILLSLCTGLRAGDIDRLPAAGLDLKRATIDTVSKKTGKAYDARPLPDTLIPALTGYVSGLPENTVRLLPDINIRKEWDAIRLKAKLPKVTRQDMRITFSTMMQKISGLETARDLLEHSSSKITGDWYSDTEYLNKLRVNKIPIDLWLKD